MSDLTLDDGPRVGELPADRAVLRPSAARGIRVRVRVRPSFTRDELGSGDGLLLELDGETSGEKGGEEGPAGDESCIGDIGRLLAYGGGLADDNRGEE